MASAKNRASATAALPEKAKGSPRSRRYHHQTSDCPLRCLWPLFYTIKFSNYPILFFFLFFIFWNTEGREKSNILIETSKGHKYFTAIGQVTIHLPHFIHYSYECQCTSFFNIWNKEFDLKCLKHGNDLYMDNKLNIQNSSSMSTAYILISQHKIY